ncbi:hypothetical protein ACFL96_02955 [Thermoproteota archaeon]
MVNKELLDWIKSEEALGYTDEQLRDYLLKQGYKKKDVDDALLPKQSFAAFFSDVRSVIIVVSLLNIILVLASYLMDFKDPLWDDAVMVYFSTMLITAGILIGIKSTRPRASILHVFYTAVILGFVSSIIIIIFFILEITVRDLSEYFSIIMIGMTLGMFLALISVVVSHYLFLWNFIRKHLLSNPIGGVFSLKDFIKKTGYGITALFILCFIFISIAFGETAQGITFLVNLAVILFFIDIFQKKGFLPYSRLSAVFFLVITFMVSVGMYDSLDTSQYPSTRIELFFLLFVVLTFCFVASMLYYYKDRKFEPLTVTFCFFVSFILAFTCVFLLLLIMVFGILGLAGNMHILFLHMFFMPLVFIFIVLFVLISIILIKKTSIASGVFDYNLFFKYKHIPFRLLNLLSSPQGPRQNLNTALKYGLVFYIIVSIIAFAGLSFAGTKLSAYIYEMDAERIDDFRGQVHNLLFEDYYSSKILDNYNILRYSEYHVWCTPGKTGHDHCTLSYEDVTEGLDYIYYDCDSATLQCTQKQRDHDVPLADDIDLSNALYYVQDYRYRGLVFVYPMIKGINDKGEDILFLFSNISREELVSLSLFDEELAQLKSAQEFEAFSQDLFKESFEEKIIEAPSSFFWLFASGNSYKTIEDHVLRHLEFMLRYKMYYSITSTLEWRSIKLNKEHNIEFYDSSQNLEEHILMLNGGIDNLMDMSKAMRFETAYFGWYIENMIPDFLDDPSGISLFKLSLIRIFEHTLVYESMESLEQKIPEMHNELYDSILDIWLQTRDVQESPESKAMRLRMIQMIIASKIYSICDEQGDLDCIREIISIAPSTRFCDGLRGEGPDRMVEPNQCYFNISTKTLNIDICSEIRYHRESDEELRNECREYIVKKIGDEQLCNELERNRIMDLQDCLFYLPAPETDILEESANLSIDEATRTLLEKCSQIRNDTLRDACMFQIAISEINPFFCDHITDISTKDNCYYSVADRAQDPELCSNIRVYNTRKHCEASIT